MTIPDYKHDGRCGVCGSALIQTSKWYFGCPANHCRLIPADRLKPRHRHKSWIHRAASDLPDATRIGWPDSWVGRRRYVEYTIEGLPGFWRVMERNDSIEAWLVVDDRRWTLRRFVTVETKGG